MKKLFSLFSILLLCVMGFGLTACGNEEPKSAIASYPNNIEVGYKIPVYPNCPFNYELTKGDTTYSFHINSISATLTKINIVEEEDTVTSDKRYFPYEFELRAYVDIPDSLINKNIRINLVVDYFAIDLEMLEVPTTTSNVEFVDTCSVNIVPVITFYYIDFN